MTHLGQNIAKLRGIRRMTQKEMAAKVGLHQPDYSKIEQKEEIDDELLALIANALDVTPEAIKNFNEEAIVNIISNNTFGDNSNFGNNPIYHFAPFDKMMEIFNENKKLYEMLLEEKDKVIAMYENGKGHDS